VSKILFGVPKEDELKKLWEDVLGIKLKKNLECVPRIKIPIQGI